MPTYEYACLGCSNHFEVFQSITADPLSQCPQCGQAVKRLISGGGGLLFKGSGFYITDYRSANYTEQAKKENCSAPACQSETKCASEGPAKTETTTSSGV